MKKFSVLKMIAVVLLPLLLMQAGCAALRDLSTVSKPELSVEEVRLTGLSFEALSLAIDVGIANPNPIAVPLAGFDYDFQIAGESFLTGEDSRQQSIAAKGRSTVQIPLKIPFKKLYAAFQKLAGADSVDYQLAAGLRFDLPLVGATRIPVKTSGRLPLLKIPKVRVGKLKVKKLSFTRADLALQVVIDNANPFAFVIEKMRYDLEVNGAPWARGLTTETQTVNEKGTTTLAIPVSLDLARTGREVYSLLRGNRELKYRLNGALDIKSSLDLLGRVSLPVDRSGTITLSR